MKVEIRRKDVEDICCKALKQYAVDKGLDPDQKIQMSRWYLDMKNNRITFIGEQNVNQRQSSKGSKEGSKKSNSVSS